MGTHQLTLIAGDVGNVTTKFRRGAGAWEVEPLVVRLATARRSSSFANGEVEVQPLEYHSSPAPIECNVPLWERPLAHSEVVLFGGGQRVAQLLTAALPAPLLGVADGIERLARHRLNTMRQS